MIENISFNDLFEKGKLAYEKGKYGQAIRYFRSALELEPNNAFAYQELARALSAAKQHDAAAENAEKALRINSQLAIPHLVLSTTYRAKQDYKHAEDEIERAFEITPNSGMAHANLAQLFAETKQYQLALQEAKKAIKLGFDIADVHFLLAATYGVSREFSKARKEYKEVLLRRPKKRIIRIAADIAITASYLTEIRWVLGVGVGILILMVMVSPGLVGVISLALVGVFFVYGAITFFLLRATRESAFYLGFALITFFIYYLAHLSPWAWLR